MIVWFENITASDTARVCGKGANLGECARACLPVLPGFCVSTDAYRDATRDVTDLLAADAAQGDATAARERVLDFLSRKRCESGSEAISGWGACGAVRSSATAEDWRRRASPGSRNLPRRGRGRGGTGRCTAVLGVAVDRPCGGVSPPARRVGRVSGAGGGGAGDGRRRHSRGVVHPRSRYRRRRHDARSSPRAGESVVAALVTPDTFTISRDPAAVMAREIGSKQTRIDQTPDGGTVTTDVPEADRAKPRCRMPVAAVVGLGERVEAHYGTGQDIEWAFVGDELYLLQARPITTSATIVEGHAPVKGHLEHTLRDDLIEHFPAPFPLDLHAVHQVQGAIQDLMGVAGVRAVPATSLLRGDDDGIVRITITTPRPTPAVLTRLPRLFAKGMRHDPALWPGEEAALRASLEHLAAQVRELASANDDTALQVVRDAVTQAATITANRFLNYLAPMMVNRTVAGWLIKLARPEQEATPEDLYAGVPYKTAEITAASRTCGMAVTWCRRPDTRPQGTVGEASPTPGGSSGRGRGFLAAHGARTARLYLPFSNRSWHEDPETFYALLAATLRGASLAHPNHDPAHGSSSAYRILRGRWRDNTARLQARHIGREGTVYRGVFCLARAGMDEIARRLVNRHHSIIPTTFVLTSMRSRTPSSTATRPGDRDAAASQARHRRGDLVGPGPTDHDEGRCEGSAARAGDRDRAGDPSPRSSTASKPVTSWCALHRPTWTPLFALAAAVVAATGGTAVPCRDRRPRVRHPRRPRHRPHHQPPTARPCSSDGPAARHHPRPTSS